MSNRNSRKAVCFDGINPVRRNRSNREVAPVSPAIHPPHTPPIANLIDNHTNEIVIAIIDVIQQIETAVSETVISIMRLSDIARI